MIADSLPHTCGETDTKHAAEKRSRQVERDPKVADESDDILPSPDKTRHGPKADRLTPHSHCKAGSRVNAGSNMRKASSNGSDTTSVKTDTSASPIKHIGPSAKSRKLVLNFHFDRSAEKARDPIHRHSGAKLGQCFEIVRDNKTLIYEPAENVPIFMWPINAAKLGFERYLLMESTPLSALVVIRKVGSSASTGQERKERQKILHAFTYTHPDLQCTSCDADGFTCTHVTLLMCPSEEGADLEQDPPLASSCLRCIRNGKADCSSRGIILAGPDRGRVKVPEVEYNLAWQVEDWDLQSKETIQWKWSRTQRDLRRLLLEERKSNASSQSEANSGSKTSTGDTPGPRVRGSYDMLEVDVSPTMPIVYDLASIFRRSFEAEKQYLDRISNYEEKIKDLRSQLTILETANEQLQTDLVTKEAESNASRKRANALEAMIDKLSDKMAETERKLESAEARPSSEQRLQKKCDDLQNSYNWMAAEKAKAYAKGFVAGAEEAREDAQKAREYGK